MKILITGGTGFIGKALIDEAASSGHELIVISRAQRDNKKYITFIPWDKEALQAAVSKSDIVINLVGEPIAKKKMDKRTKRFVI